MLYSFYAFKLNIGVNIQGPTAIKLDHKQWQHMYIQHGCKVWVRKLEPCGSKGGGRQLHCYCSALDPLEENSH